MPSSWRTTKGARVALGMLVMLAFGPLLGGCAGYARQPAYGPGHPAQPVGSALPVELPRIPVVEFVGADPSGLPSEPPTWKARGHVGHGEAAGDAAESTIYVCPMHPEVIESKPGRCPLCGMNLVPGKRP